MTRAKKNQREQEIISAWWALLSRENAAFDEWLDMDYTVHIISKWTNHSERKVRKIFWQKLYPQENFRALLREINY